MKNIRQVLITALLALALQPLPAQERDTARQEARDTLLPPKAKVMPSRPLSGSACIDFPVERTVIYPGYRRNTVELGKIQATIDSLCDGRDVTITSVRLKGYASPDGSYRHNREVAAGRTAALKKHIVRLYHFADSIILTAHEPEDWEGLRRRVEESDIGHRTEILALIDSDMEPDAKEAKIKRAYPKEYRFMLQNFYPALRRADYRIDYDVRTFSDAEETTAPADTAVTLPVQVRETLLPPEQPERADSTSAPAAPVAAEPGARVGWYAGIQAGLPFGVSAYSSFGEDKTRVGWSTGIHGGYRFNGIYSLEAQAAWGQFNLSSRDCCPSYWLGSDGRIYEGAVAGMTGWDWHSLKSRVFMQRYGVQFNVNVLGFFAATRGGRWSLEISPQVNATGTKAAFRTIAGNAKAMKGATRWHFGAGGNVQAGCRLTENLLLGVYTGLIWYSGNPIDGTHKYLHKANYVWETGVRVGWHFGSKGKEARR